jgi:serine/threonine-protein kinase
LTTLDMGSPPGDPDDPLVGRVLSERYRVIKPIGEGGIGRVYLAEHLGTGREVALKVLLAEFAGNLAFAQAFLEEAHTVSRLGHENIIDIYYGGRSPDGYAFLVMEHLKGRDLADTLSDLGPMPWERARPIFLQISSALAAVHEHGFVHGDIKPANLFLVTASGHHDFVKVLDFGVAKAVGVGARAHDDRVPILGTPQYIAPEQVMARAEVDARADQYSLGCVLYRTLTGTVPFHADTPLALITKHAYEKPVPPRAMRPDLDIPVSAETIVLRALEKDPAKRYPSMKAMGEAIARARLASSTPAGGSSVGQFRMSDPAVLHRRLRRRLLTLAVVAVVLGAAAALVLAVRAQREGQVELALAPSEAAVSVDGKTVDVNTAVSLPPGHHQLHVSSPGYLPQTRELEVEPGQRQVATVSLAPSPETRFRITSTPPGALIWIDGTPVRRPDGVQAATPYMVPRLRPGPHEVELRTAAGSWRRAVDAEPDRVVEVHGLLVAAPRPRRP